MPICTVLRSLKLLFSVSRVTDGCVPVSLSRASGGRELPSDPGNICRAVDAASVHSDKFSSAGPATTTATMCGKGRELASAVGFTDATSRGRIAAASRTALPLLRLVARLCLMLNLIARLLPCHALPCRLCLLLCTVRIQCHRSRSDGHGRLSYDAIGGGASWQCVSGRSPGTRTSGRSPGTRVEVDCPRPCENPP